MVKADEKVVLNEEIEEKYTYFEELQKRVEQLQEMVEEQASILLANNITRTDVVKASYFNDDKLFTALEEMHDEDDEEI